MDPEPRDVLKAIARVVRGVPPAAPGGVPPLDWEGWGKVLGLLGLRNDHQIVTAVRGQVVRHLGAGASNSEPQGSTQDMADRGGGRRRRQEESHMFVPVGMGVRIVNERKLDSKTQMYNIVKPIARGGVYCHAWLDEEALSKVLKEVTEPMLAHWKARTGQAGGPVLPAISPFDPVAVEALLSKSHRQSKQHRMSDVAELEHHISMPQAQNLPVVPPTLQAALIPPQPLRSVGLQQAGMTAAAQAQQPAREVQERPLRGSPDEDRDSGDAVVSPMDSPHPRQPPTRPSPQSPAGARPQKVPRGAPDRQSPAMQRPLPPVYHDANNPTSSHCNPETAAALGASFKEAFMRAYRREKQAVIEGIVLAEHAARAAARHGPRAGQRGLTARCGDDVVVPELSPPEQGDRGGGPPAQVASPKTAMESETATDRPTTGHRRRKRDASCSDLMIDEGAMHRPQKRRRQQSLEAAAPQQAFRAALTVDTGGATTPSAATAGITISSGGTPSPDPSQQGPFHVDAEDPCPQPSTELRRYHPKIIPDARAVAAFKRLGEVLRACRAAYQQNQTEQQTRRQDSPVQETQTDKARVSAQRTPCEEPVTRTPFYTPDAAADHGGGCMPAEAVDLEQAACQAGVAMGEEAMAARGELSTPKGLAPAIHDVVAHPRTSCTTLAPEVEARQVGGASTSSQDKAGLGSGANADRSQDAGTAMLAKDARDPLPISPDSSGPPVQMPQVIAARTRRPPVWFVGRGLPQCTLSTDAGSLASTSRVEGTSTAAQRVPDAPIAELHCAQRQPPESVPSRSRESERTNIVSERIPEAALSPPPPESGFYQVSGTVPPSAPERVSLVGALGPRLDDTGTQPASTCGNPMVCRQQGPSAIDRVDACPKLHSRASANAQVPAALGSGSDHQQEPHLVDVENSLPRLALQSGSPMRGGRQLLVDSMAAHEDVASGLGGESVVKGVAEQGSGVAVGATRTPIATDMMQHIPRQDCAKDSTECATEDEVIKEAVEGEPRGQMQDLHEGDPQQDESNRLPEVSPRSFMSQGIQTSQRLLVCWLKDVQQQQSPANKTATVQTSQALANDFGPQAGAMPFPLPMAQPGQNQQLLSSMGTAAVPQSTYPESSTVIANELPMGGCATSPNQVGTVLGVTKEGHLTDGKGNLQSTSDAHTHSGFRGMLGGAIALASAVAAAMSVGIPGPRPQPDPLNPSRDQGHIPERGREEAAAVPVIAADVAPDSSHSARRVDKAMTQDVGDEDDPGQDAVAHPHKADARDTPRPADPVPNMVVAATAAAAGERDGGNSRSEVAALRFGQLARRGIPIEDVHAWLRPTCAPLLAPCLVQDSLDVQNVAVGITSWPDVTMVVLRQLHSIPPPQPAGQAPPGGSASSVTYVESTGDGDWLPNPVPNSIHDVGMLRMARDVLGSLPSFMQAATSVAAVPTLEEARRLVAGSLAGVAVAAARDRAQAVADHQGSSQQAPDGVPPQRAAEPAATWGLNSRGKEHEPQQEQEEQGNTTEDPVEDFQFVLGSAPPDFFTQPHTQLF